MESTQPLSSSYRDKAQPEGDAQDRGFSGFYSPVQKPGAGMNNFMCISEFTISSKDHNCRVN